VEIAMGVWKHALASVLLPFALAAGAQSPGGNYPSKAIKWVVPYTPGGITDTVTRLVTQKLQESLGQPIVIENKPGANSIVGADLVAKSAPDGYNVVTVIAAHAANKTLYAGKLPFDPVKDFAPVSLVAVAPLILTVNNDFPARDVKGLIEYAKANPGKISFGSSGVGAAAHLTTELLKQAAGIDMVHVPYKGTAPALTAILSGETQALVAALPATVPYVNSGRLRALGVTSSQRAPAMKNVPTMIESGIKGFDFETWYGLFGPAGLSRDLVAKLNGAVNKTIAQPDVKDILAKQGIDPAGGTAEAFDKAFRAEVVTLGKVIIASGAKPE
jgi:tripartite-type tricarboxylate transporter receptor subunit TctC